MSYAYNCEMYCDDCAGDAIAELNRLGFKDSGDTNEYPQHVDNDESDCSEHCAECSEFLENSLTTDGMDYVREAVAEALELGRNDCVALTEWKDYYGIKFECEWCGCDVRPYTELCDECGYEVSDGVDRCDNENEEGV